MTEDASSSELVHSDLVQFPAPSPPLSSFADIDLLVSQCVEESAHLEFKQQLPEAGRNDPIAKAIASFANSDGGVLIYGIADDGEGRAAALCPVTLAGALERIDLIARQTLDGPVAIQTSSITSPSDPALGFVIVSIPRSLRAPHFHKGTAWGRSSRTVTTLTRRQIGDLFARQPGFAGEFNLVSTTPGRVRVELISEETPGMSGLIYYLLFQNDGDSDVFDVTYEMEPTETSSHFHLVDDGFFPAPVMHSGAVFRLHLVRRSRATFRVHTRWRDSQGQFHSAEWSIGH